MCGRYFIHDEDGREDELAAFIGEMNRLGLTRDPALKTSGEIFPTDLVPVIANSRDMRPRPFAMQWGYALAGGRRVINTRSETAAQSAMFADGMAQRRLLVPASHYFEWAHRGREKVRYAIRPKSSGMLYMAGVYRFEQGKPVFSILTRSPAESIAFIHHRMPVILPREAMVDWLNPRFRADEVLHAAVTDMRYEAMEQQSFF